ncbi:MAG TPA: aminoglycoside phosphotransferase family protein [Caulobacteraceae bacterium]|nr:aminoglycoside phosphotransferase family protein [Caulobacteraceae bacterium]
MQGDYAHHLARLHAGFEAPDELIAAAARAVSASPIAGKRRIVHGEANEVYALALESGLEVILRIARRADGLFEKERWAIDRCRALGMRVPQVFSTGRYDVAGESLDVCVLEKLAGERLSDSLALPRQTLEKVVRQLGEQLSRLHSIRADDLGEGARFFANDTDDFLAIEAEFVELGVAAGLDPAGLGRAFRFFEATMAGHAALPRSLTHNDLRACHVLVHDGELSGLIDFGEASIDSPINEFAKWDFWEGEALPTRWLEEGYAGKSLFAEGYGEVFAALRLANALWALRWYALTGYPAGAERAKTRLSGYMAGLGLV